MQLICRSLSLTCSPMIKNCSCRITTLLQVCVRGHYRTDMEFLCSQRSIPRQNRFEMYWSFRLCIAWWRSMTILERRKKKKSHQWFIGEQLLVKLNLRLLMNPHIHQASFQLIKETQKAEEAEVFDESLGKLTNLLHSSAEMFRDVYNYFIISL